ncbi:hypothetical protein PR202_gb10644 [Eleusine coracana subsp. coracana]|uniref:ENT domain-containing protein n=1 Tax=Eleusine coracana subsp. coracana TaxID=191504 RepID=A0AAV5EJU1_ELECO|nr:hypothetical protein PR202_gb10644 [Eleusine coracana subsp. coracana]
MKLKSSTAGIFKENGMILNSEGTYGLKSVWPKQPAAVQARCKWIIGDVTEVFDRNTWKLGKILKMSKNDYFVIRLADCIQLKEFHISSLRIPNASGAPYNKQLPTSDKATRAQPQGNGKKRKAAADASHHLSKRAHPRNITPASNLHGAMADSYLQSPSQVSRDEAECSVASCSVNNPEDHLFYGDVRGKRHAAVAAFPDDAMSSCPCTSGMEGEEEGNCHEEELAVEVDVHALELEAYRSTMRALYASGPLTWEQESLLTNLRMSLNISNEEHLRQLRRLLASS